MLKTVYQHTMSQKSEQVAEMVDTFFEENLRTDYARKSGGRSPRIYQLRRKTPAFRHGDISRFCICFH